MEEENIDKKPELIVFAGPNGSGKSTYTTSEWVVQPYINADDIERALCCSTIEAALIADEKRHEAIDARQSFSFETVLSTDRNLLLMQEAKDKGYFIRGYFILTSSAQLNVKRVEARVKNGGHDVPEDTIIRRYHKSLANIPRFVEICDISHVYDNTIRADRIFRKHKKEETVMPTEIWTEEEILKLVYGNPLKNY